MSGASKNESHPITWSLLDKTVDYILCFSDYLKIQFRLVSEVETFSKSLPEKSKIDFLSCLLRILAARTYEKLLLVSKNNARQTKVRFELIKCKSEILDS